MFIYISMFFNLYFSVNVYVVSFAHSDLFGESERQTTQRRTAIRERVLGKVLNDAMVQLGGPTCPLCGAVPQARLSEKCSFASAPLNANDYALESYKHIVSYFVIFNECELSWLADMVGHMKLLMFS
jgi:hypothetical protein